MKAFNNDPKLKEFYVNRMNEHAAADEIIQGTGWENGKGCFIGCTLHSYDHEKFESEGIGPEWLGYLADKIFEGLSNEKAKDFAAKFYPSMRVGIDLEQVKKDFLVFVMQENLKTLDACEYDKKEWPEVAASIDQTKKAIELCIEYQRGNVSESAAVSAAESAAVSARSAAVSAAESAAVSAWSAAWSAESAAWSAAWSAEWSAEWSAAWSAEWSAESAARSAAWSAAYELYATELLRLLKGGDL